MRKELKRRSARRGAKSITVAMQFQNNATSPTSVSIVTTPVVTNGVLVPGHNMTNPGVFTAGTAREGTSPYTTQTDSNS